MVVFDDAPLSEPHQLLFRRPFWRAPYAVSFWFYVIASFGVLGITRSGTPAQKSLSPPRWKGGVFFVPGIVLLDEVAWSENTDGKTSLLSRLTAGKDVPAIQGQEELAFALDRGGQHVGVLGIDEGGVFLKGILRGYGEELPVDLSKISVKAGQRLLGKISFQGVEGLQDDEESGLRGEPSPLAGFKKKSGDPFWGMGSGYQH